MLNILAALAPAASRDSEVDAEDLPLRMRLMGGELADDGKLTPAGKRSLGDGRLGG